MKQIKLIILLLFLIPQSFGQEKKMAPVIYAGYSSSLIYPGAKAGIEVPIKRVEIRKSKRKKKHFFKAQFLTFNIGGYYHPDFHTNLYFTAGYTRRRTLKNGFFTQLSPELGYNRTFLTATTYQVNDDGQISKKKMAGYNHIMASFGLGLGYDWSVRKSKPIALYAKLNLLTAFPYNSTIYIRPATEVGIIYTPTIFNTQN